MSKTVKLSDLVKGATFDCIIGLVTIVDVIKDGYDIGQDEFKCTISGSETTFSDDARELKSFLNEHKK